MIRIPKIPSYLSLCHIENVMKAKRLNERVDGKTVPILTPGRELQQSKEEGGRQKGYTFSLLGCQLSFKSSQIL